VLTNVRKRGLLATTASWVRGATACFLIHTALLATCSAQGGGPPILSLSRTVGPPQTVDLTIANTSVAVQYDVQRASSLSLSDWSTIGIVQGNGDTVFFRDSNLGTAPRAFYRLLTTGATVIPRTDWSLQFVDSQETSQGSTYLAYNCFDGNINTFWHTEWINAQPPPPHEIQIDLGAMYNVSGFDYLPRQDGQTNGWIKDYEFYVSIDGINWGTPVATGTFAPTASQQEVVFAPTTGQYIRLRALTEVNGLPYTAVAELNVLNTGDRPPDSSINSPAADVTIAPGDILNFSGSGTDPENDVPFAYHWTFGDPAIPDSNVAAPGPVQFNNLGVFAITFTVTDSKGNVDPVPATRTVTVKNPPSPIIPHTNWSLEYVDSVDTSGNYAATNAFDDDASTFWHTEWYDAQPPPPHEIQINLGSIYTVDGFRYLPRQDGQVQGRIGQYLFYVSMDGVNWGNPVAGGTFPNTALEQEVQFLPVAGHYVRLVALTEANGLPFTAVAELNVLQAPTPTPTPTP
jgi:F5/8 type C domain/PKD domain